MTELKTKKSLSLIGLTISVQENTWNFDDDITQ